MSRYRSSYDYNTIDDRPMLGPADDILQESESNHGSLANDDYEYNPEAEAEAKKLLDDFDELLPKFSEPPVEKCDTPNDNNHYGTLPIWYKRMLDSKIRETKDRLELLSNIVCNVCTVVAEHIKRIEHDHRGTTFCQMDYPRHPSLNNPWTNSWKFNCVIKCKEASKPTHSHTYSCKSQIVLEHVDTGVSMETPNICRNEYPQFVMDAVELIQNFANKSMKDIPYSDVQGAPEISMWTGIKLVIRSNYKNQLMLVVRGRKLGSIKRPLKEYFDYGPGKYSGVISIYMIDQGWKKNINKIEAERITGLFSLSDKIGSVFMEYKPKISVDFNAIETAQLGQIIKEYAGLTMETTLLDIGCSFGVLSLMMSGDCERVFGLNTMHAANNDLVQAEEIKKMNGIENVSFIGCNPEDLITRCSAYVKGYITVAVVNLTTPYGKSKYTMDALRNIPSIWRVIVYGPFLKEHRQNIAKLTIANPESGESFLPMRGCILDKSPSAENAFDIVILFERPSLIHPKMKLEVLDSGPTVNVKTDFEAGKYEPLDVEDLKPNISVDRNQNFRNSEEICSSSVFRLSRQYNHSPSPDRSVRSPSPIRLPGYPPPRRSQLSPSPNRTDSSPSPIRLPGYPPPRRSRLSPSPNRSVSSPSPIRLPGYPLPRRSQRSPSPSRSVRSPSSKRLTGYPPPRRFQRSPSPKRFRRSRSPKRSRRSPSPRRSRCSPSPRYFKRSPSSSRKLQCSPSPKKPRRSPSPRYFKRSPSSSRRSQGSPSPIRFVTDRHSDRSLNKHRSHPVLPSKLKVKTEPTEDRLPPKSKSRSPPSSIERDRRPDEDKRDKAAVSYPSLTVRKEFQFSCRTPPLEIPPTSPMGTSLHMDASQIKEEDADWNIPSWTKVITEPEQTEDEEESTVNFNNVEKSASFSNDISEPNARPIIVKSEPMDTYETPPQIVSGDSAPVPVPVKSEPINSSVLPSLIISNESATVPVTIKSEPMDSHEVSPPLAAVENNVTPPTILTSEPLTQQDVPAQIQTGDDINLPVRIKSEPLDTHELRDEDSFQHTDDTASASLYMDIPMPIIIKSEPVDNFKVPSQVGTIKTETLQDPQEASSNAVDFQSMETPIHTPRLVDSCKNSVFANLDGFEFSLDATKSYMTSTREPEPTDRTNNVENEPVEEEQQVTNEEIGEEMNGGQIEKNVNNSIKTELEESERVETDEEIKIVNEIIDSKANISIIKTEPRNDEIEIVGEKRSEQQVESNPKIRVKTEDKLKVKDEPKVKDESDDNEDDLRILIEQRKKLLDILNQEKEPRQKKELPRSYQRHSSRSPSSRSSRKHNRSPSSSSSNRSSSRKHTSTSSIGRRESSYRSKRSPSPSYRRSRRSPTSPVRVKREPYSPDRSSGSARRRDRSRRSPSTSSFKRDVYGPAGSRYRSRSKSPKRRKSRSSS